MPASTASRPNGQVATGPAPAGVVVACPDSRPPAYEAVAGLAAAGMLDRFLTAFYYDETQPVPRLARGRFPTRFARIERRLQRRSHAAIPSDRVIADPAVDLSLAVENRLPSASASARDWLARRRTRRFDRRLAHLVDHRRPGSLVVFSDVASEFTLPLCQQRGIGTVLSMVHGDVREECEVLELEAERSPGFFAIYLADGPIESGTMRWLHERRLRELALADRVLVPSDHIAGRLIAHGTEPDRIRVVPYAADIDRFRPRPDSPRADARCVFLFAGGITQRKGIRYLLEAWRQVRRPGWSLQLLGGLPSNPAPLEPFRDEVEWLGQVGHAEMPRIMAAADVFVFPSLFEGSAVVTYEALACGLPSIVTSAAGSVVRDGREGLVVPSADIPALAAAIERLGTDPEYRRALARQARHRAEEFTWTRYHREVVAAARDVGGS